MSIADSSKALPVNFDESLIDLVRQNPLLFAKDARVRPYEYMKGRYDLWKSIATSLGVEPNFCIIRWRNLCDRYRRATQIKKKTNQPADDWPLMEKMLFLDRSVNCSHMLSHKLKEDTRKVPIVEPASKDETYSGVNYDYLPEAMEAQSSTSNEAFNKTTPLMSNTMPSSTNSALVRIKALLDGLDPTNRTKAEKRILTYLCKCQLRTLENENIDNIDF